MGWSPSKRFATHTVPGSSQPPASRVRHIDEGTEPGYAVANDRRDPAPAPGLLANRFALGRELGRGSFGVVYEALDTHLNSRVALKQLVTVNPISISRFKTEFRALADLSHPNLVTLHEFFMDRGCSFFTMELVQGRDFVSAVRESTTCDRNLTHLRDALAQLVEAVEACHTAGYLHRDIKPSNVLLTSGFRVVLLDFGLVAATAGRGPRARSHGLFAGTPAYMAPELFGSAAPSRASDWYSVGVMLHEILSGKDASGLNPLEMLRLKQKTDWFLEGLVDAPSDLRDICRDLLQRAPEARPSYESIARRCAASERRPAARGGRFQGRDTALDELRAALDRPRQGSPSFVRISGPSGIGKTTLVHEFLLSLRVDPSITVLEGRCGEFETVAYNALDALLDAAVDCVDDTDRDPFSLIEPASVGPLLQVFPCFGRLSAFDGISVEAHGGDAPDLRDQAFAALHALFAAIARSGPLVVFLDDLQWADADSVTMLRALFARELDYGILLIASHRDEGDNAHGIFAALDAIGTHTVAGFRELHVGPLNARDAQLLARSLVVEAHDATITSILAESGGHPYLIHELAQVVHDSGTQALGASLNTLLATRVKQLPAPAQRLMEVISIAGRPLEIDALKHWSGADGSLEFITALRRARLVRTVGNRASDSIDVYHDRIRDAVLAGMAPEAQARVHRRLAEDLEATRRGQPEELMNHWKASGELSRAARFAELAGDQSMRALAFDRAARLYRIALDLAAAEPDSANPGSPGVQGLRGVQPSPRWQIWRKLGDALLYDGRGIDSARAYTEAASDGSHMEKVELRRLAAEQFLRSGRIAEGMHEMEKALSAVRLTLPRTRWQAMAWLLAERTLIAARGLRFSERTADEVAPLALAQVDVCWSARTGLSLIDYPLHIAFQSRHLLLALSTGEPYRVSRALIAEGGLLGGNGRRTSRRADALVTAGRKLAEGVGDRYLIASALLTKGANELFLGRWQSSREYLELAEPIFREECRGVTWDISTAHLFLACVLSFLGELPTLRERMELYVKRAEQLSDLYASVSISLYAGVHDRLARDAVADAARYLAETRARWPSGTFHVQHWLALRAEIDLLLYRGAGREALRLLSESERAFAGAFLDRVQLNRVEWNFRKALAALQAGGHADLAQARDAARRLSNEGLPWTTPLAAIVNAALAARRGRPRVASANCREAVAGFERASMPLFAAAARHRLAGLVGGREGIALEERAAAKLSSCGVENPPRFIDLYAPTMGTEPT